MKKQKKHNKQKQKLRKPPKSFKSGNILWLLGILSITFIAYYPATQNDFTNWDDYEYVVENPYIRDFSGENLKFIFSESFMGNYHPFTMLSLGLDYKIGKLDPKIYHYVNIFLHILNTALVFYLVLLLFGNKKKNLSLEIAIITSALFGVHSFHVESVVWISERKDVLYTLFFLASLISYTIYTLKIKRIEDTIETANDTGKEPGKAGYKFYIISIFLFLFSILSKGMAVSLAVTIIAIDYLVGRKIFSKKAILEKIPFFLIAIIFGVIAINSQKFGHDTATATSFTFPERGLFACYGLTQYFFKLFVPINFSAFYPYPEEVTSVYWFYPLIIIAIVFLFVKFYKRSRPLTFGLLFFLINIALVLQLLPVGNAIMADRYVYIPSIGFFLIIALGYKSIIEKKENLTKFLNYFISACIILLIMQTRNISEDWKNSETLWSNVISKHENVKFAWNNRGLAKQKTGDIRGALNDFNMAIKLDSFYMEAYNNRGGAISDLGNHKGAIADYNIVLKNDPADVKALTNRGVAYFKLKKFPLAVGDYNKAMEIQSDFSPAYYNRGIVKQELKEYDSAIIDYNRAIEINPYYCAAFFRRGYINHLKEDLNKAMLDYNQTINCDPKHGNAYFNRGAIYIKLGNRDKGCKDLGKSASLGYDKAQEEYNNNCK